MRLVYIRTVLIALLTGVGLLGCGAQLSQLSDPDIKLPPNDVLDGAVSISVTGSALTKLTTQAGDILSAIFPTTKAGWICVSLDELFPDGFPSMPFAVGPLSTDVEIREATICLNPQGLTLDLIPNHSPPTIRLHADHLHVGFEKPAIIAGTTEFLGLATSVACTLDNDKKTNDGTPYAVVLTLTVDIELVVDDAGHIGISPTTHEFVLNEVGLSVSKDCGLPECADPNLGGLVDSCLECDVCTAADFGSDLTALAVDLIGDALDPLVTLAVNVLTKPLIDDWLNGQMTSIAGRVSLSNVLGSTTESLQTAEDMVLVSLPAPNGLKTVEFGDHTVLQFHTQGGTSVDTNHACVGPLISAPTFTPGPFPMMVGVAQDGTQYDLALAFSEAFLNQLVWSLYRSGSLCLGLTTRELATLTQGKLLLRTGPLDVLVPGVATLAGRDASVRIRLLPTLTTTDLPILRVGGKDGVIGLNWPAFGLALEAFVDNDYMRLMTLRADVSVSMGVEVQEDTLGFSIVDLVVDNVVVSDNEAFEEMDLEAVISLGLEVALSALSGANDLVIPMVPKASGAANGALGSLPLELVGVDAVGADHDWLAVYLAVSDISANKPGTKKVPHIQHIEVVRSGVVSIGEIPSSLPILTRVDGLMWHRTSSLPDRRGKVWIEHPLLRIPGMHEIEVRVAGSRQAFRVVMPAVEPMSTQVPSNSSTDPSGGSCALGGGGLAPWWLLALPLLFIGKIPWRRVFACALLIVGVGACSPPATLSIACDQHADCPSGTTCNPASGLCVVPSACERDEECCPGLMCINGACRTVEECHIDGDCLGLDDRCEQGVCVATFCEEDEECIAPYHQCLVNRCARAQPCESCQSGTICEPTTGRCVAVSGACASLECPAGMVAMVSEGNVPWGHACPSVVDACACVAIQGVLPVIPSAWVNLLTSIGTDGPRHTVVARDLRYGDLVALSLDLDGTVLATDYLDGVPNGPVVYDPTGARGGIVEPGPNVGAFAAAVPTDAGFAVVARDATRGVLRFVSRTDDSALVAYDLDADGDAGYGASMDVGQDRSLHVTSFAVNDAGMLLLRSARTSPGNDMPADVESWISTTIPIDLGPLEPVAMCAASCPIFEACVEVGGAAECHAVDWMDTCASKCPVGYACVESNCRRVVRHTAALKPWRDFPQGETATAMAGGHLVLAYENPRLGTLNVWASAPGAVVNAFHVAVDGGNGDRVGRHLAMDGNESGSIALAYQDTTRGLLKLVWGNPTQGVTPWTIDTGGKGIDVQFTADERLVIVHGQTEGQGVRVLVGLPNDWAVVDPVFSPHVGRFSALSLFDGVAMLVTVRNRITADWSPEVVLETAAIAVW